MLTYRGRYRVLYEIDSAGRACEFTNIPCGIRKGANISRHDSDTLNVFIPSTKTASRLLKEYRDIFMPFQVGDHEATLLFKESNIDKAAAILKARIKGKDMSARPKRQVAISEERRRELSEQMKQIQAKSKITGTNVRKTG